MMQAHEIKQKRKALGLTQIEAAKAAGVSVQAYRLWENGGNKPSPENEKRLREVLRG